MVPVCRIKDKYLSDGLEQQRKAIIMNTMKTAVLAGLATMLMAVGGVSAATYTIEHSHSQGIGSANVSFNGGASTVSSYLGRFIMEPKTALPSNYAVYSIETVHGPEMGFYSYCLEPLQSIGVGHGTAYQYQFSIDTLAGTDGIDAGDAAMINELFGRYCPVLQYDPTGPYTGGTFRTAAAALQLAIWKINLDRTTETLGAWDFSSGLMRVSATAVTLETGANKGADVVALAMLNSLTGNGPMTSQLEGLRNSTTQDLLIQVPEPATMSLLVLGGLAMIRRRRK